MTMRSRLTFAVVVCAGLLLSAAVAQDRKPESQLRTVRGQVLDRDENPRPSGVVYLKNLKTSAVKTYIADDGAQYRFSGLDPNTDYEVHAEYEGMMSGKRRISSFDTRKDIVANLKLDKKKE